MQGTLFIAAIFLAAGSAFGQIELTSRVVSVTILASGGARVETGSTAPAATGEVCWLNLPLESLRGPGHDPQIELSPATLFDGPARFGKVARPHSTFATNMAGLLAANTGAFVEVRAGTNEFFKGKLRLSGELALVEEATNRTVAVAVSAISVLRRLDGALHTQRETSEPVPALLATCISTNATSSVRLSYTLPGLRWSPAYELATNTPTTARLTLHAQLEGDFAALRGVPARFVLRPGEPAREAKEIAGKKTALFAEDVPCERLAHVVMLDRPDAPALVHAALRLSNRTSQAWPSAPLGTTALPATDPGGVAMLVLEETAPLRLNRRVREISRHPARQTPVGAGPLDEILAVGMITLLNETSAPLRTLVLRAAPDVVEETAPAAISERDASGGRWLRWEMNLPPREPVTLEFRYRALVKPEPTK
ncbi:MAG: hypothetical protein NT105_16645 [Verrucomicrobia bacterium]|nr:hypothetical protein [Verrucomicrobiota bacterium]